MSIKIIDVRERAVDTAGSQDNGRPQCKWIKTILWSAAIRAPERGSLSGVSPCYYTARLTVIPSVIPEVPGFLSGPPPTKTSTGYGRSVKFSLSARVTTLLLKWRSPYKQRFRSLYARRPPITPHVRNFSLAFSGRSNYTRLGRVRERNSVGTSRTRDSIFLLYKLYVKKPEFLLFSPRTQLQVELSCVSPMTQNCYILTFLRIFGWGILINFQHFCN